MPSYDRLWAVVGLRAGAAFVYMENLFLVRLHFANIGLLEVQSPFVTCLALLWTRIEVKKQTVANFQ